jgi:ribokinase
MARIAVLGSITLDAVARMPRFPSPGETLFADRLDVFPGGKGLNQAIAAARLGASVTLLGRVGRDVFADILLDAAAGDAVDTSGVRRGDGATGFAVPIVVPGGENAILAAPGANLSITAAELDVATIEAADALLVQFETPLETVTAAIAIARGAGTRVVLNPAPALPFDRRLLASVDVLVVNEVELAMLTDGEEDAATGARMLLSEGGAGAVVVALGPAGGCWAAGEQAAAFAAFHVDAVDTVGAGDGFCGALAVALCEGMDWPEATRFAEAAAAVSVTRPGAAPSLARRDEVADLLGR